MANDSNYVRKIVSLSEKYAVVTHRPITTEHGIKLVDTGVLISELLYEKLICHNLLPPIDECLTVDNAVTPITIASGISALLGEGKLGALLMRPDEHDRILDIFAKLPLNPILAFKLTVAREQMPNVFQRSLEVALCAVVLTLYAQKASEKQLVEAAAAGLFHDLGLLHVNTEMLLDERHLSEPERRHIYSHPLLGHVILSRFPEWHPTVSRAVLEHHERMDGSGYPRGFDSTEITPLGQLLGLAQLVPALFARRRFVPLAKHVHVILRLNKGKFSRNLADAMTDLVLNNGELNGSGQLEDKSYSEILSDLVTLSVAINDWYSIAQRSRQLPVCELISHRIDWLVKNCAGVGLDFRYWGMIDTEVANDPATLQELAAAALEGRWQLRAIAQEVQRKWDKLRPQSSVQQEDIWNWVRRIEGEALLAPYPG